MNRKEAIQHVMFLSSANIMDCCINDEEERGAEAETRAALLALGVTEDELESAR